MYAFLKRVFDFLFASMGLIVLSPLFLIIIILLSIVNRGNPMFLQNRPGKNARVFRLIKFRTMNDRRNSKGELLPDDIRLTTIGRIIRSTSLDELPQLINILTGDMSLIGPRPLLPEYLPLYNPRQARRHDVRPGITGWAQVNGRNTLSWEDKFEMDVWYVDNMSFRLDVKIFFLTLLKVVKREGISSANAATMERFVGNGKKRGT